MQVEKLETRFRNIIVTSGMLSVYMLLGYNFFPNGFSTIFFEFLWKWMQILMLCSGVIFFLLCFKRNIPFNLFKKMEKFESKDLILLLLPMTPIFQYIFFNYETLSVVDIVFVLSFFLVLILIFAYLIPCFLSVFASKRILTHVAIFSFFIIFYMPFFIASALNPTGAIFPTIFFVIISAFFFANISEPKQIFTFILVTFFLMNTAISVLSSNNNIFSFPQTFEDSSIVSAFENKEIIKKNDIILVVYESYANYETMLLYGFDNKAQIVFLEENGFDVYHGIYSLGAPSLPSMSKVFSLEPKRFDTTERVGRKIITGSGSVHNILRKKGYKLHCVFQNDFFFRSLYPKEIQMDSYFPDFHGGSSASVLIQGILTGYFHDRLGTKGVGFDAYLEKKHSVFNQQNSTPKFVYTHSIKPGHSPSAGIVSSDQEEVLSLYIRQIQEANEEMRQDVNLLKENNPEAIIIIAGDHGPFMTKQGYFLHKGQTDHHTDDIDRVDIQDRYGAFLAIKWPEKEYARKHDIKILQDIFPAVFSYLFNDDTLFDIVRIHKRATPINDRILGVYVEEGMIIGGKDDGKPLFEGIQ